MAEAFELGDQAAGVGLFMAVLEPVRAEVAVGLVAFPDRTVQVPTNYQQPGWFKLGPSPGQVGSAVILGHVDDRRGPAVFFRLRSL